MDSTHKFSVSIPKRISIPEGKEVDRDQFYTWLWNQLSEFGLLGVYEGTLLNEEAAEQGFETDSWTVDSAEAPRERDWVEQQKEVKAELYFSDRSGAVRANQLLSKIPNLNSGKVEEEKPQDWDAQWKATFLNSGQGVPIPPFWRVVPPWVETVGSRSNEILIKINPGAGFGTGTHETTQLCLQAIGETYKKSLYPSIQALDFGSGSGILSVGLALLGARVDAVEIDPLAIDNAVENSSINGTQNQIQNLNALPSADQKYEIVIANILRPVLLQFAEELVKRLQKGGTLILSGLIDPDLSSVLATYGQLLSLTHSARILNNGEWRAIVFEKN